VNSSLQPILPCGEDVFSDISVFLNGVGREGEIIGVRNVARRNLAEDIFGVSDRIAHEGDAKRFSRSTRRRPWPTGTGSAKSVRRWL